MSIDMQTTTVCPRGCVHAHMHRLMHERDVNGVYTCGGSGGGWSGADQATTDRDEVTCPRCISGAWLPSYLCQPVGCAGTESEPCPNRTAEDAAALRIASATSTAGIRCLACNEVPGMHAVGCIEEREV